MERTTQAANAVVATSITLWGVATGLSYEVLLAGFSGGLVSLSFLPPMGIWRRIWTPVTATLTAGYISPVVVPLLPGAVGAPDAAGTAGLICSAFLVGLTTQLLIPVVMKRVHARLEAHQ